MRFALTLLILRLAACDTTSPEERVAGSYQAERYAVTFQGDTADFLPVGGRFEMDLTADGRFTADIETPDVPEIEGDQSFAVTFDGTYALSGGDIVFFHSEDLFVRDLDWATGNGTIRTSDSLSNGTQFDIVLRRG